MALESAITVGKDLFQLLTNQETQYLFNYNSNITKLRGEIKNLEDKEDTIKLQVDAAKTKAEIIRPDVLGWVERAENIKKEANELLERELGCLFWEGPTLCSRYCLSKQAFEKANEIIKLREETISFGAVGHPGPPGQMPFASPQEFDCFVSRVRIENDVMEALGNNSINIIGICGMAGVGKTTLVKQIADKVKARNLFDWVVMVIVSKDVSVVDIQDQLAKNLGLKIEERTNRRRAERLYTRLMNKDERILIILDDLWQELYFRNIGIPVAGESEGLKVLLTSRYKEVCSDMRARPLIEVEVLSEEESWHLFKEAAEISEEANDIRDIAKEVANECGGLPLAIMVVGKALRKKKDHTWREALQQLREASVTSIRGMQDLVYSRIELSYAYLENDESRSLLLLCSLFPEDHNIPLEYLVKYVKGMQWYKNAETVARIRDKVYSIADELKSCYLLLAGNDNDCVKLHDVIRDFCLSIASSNEHIYMVRHAGLKEWPQEDSRTPYTAISLTFDEIDELPSFLECPNLQLLRLNFRQDKLYIHEQFFKEMNGLKVLELNLNGELPSSLQSLVNLRTLCFYNCRLFGDTSIIGSPKKLEILSFSGSYLKHFPKEIVELSNLKILDLTCKEGPALPSGILVNLRKLEELYLDSCHLGYLVDANDFSIGKRGAFIKLEKLVIRNANNLEELCHGNLPPGSFTSLREVRIDNAPTLRHLWGAIQRPCLGNLRILETKFCHSIETLFLQSSLECLRQLREMSIRNCFMLETLVSNDEGDEEDTRCIEFPELEILILERLTQFRSFNSGQKTLFSKVMLPNLRTLEIRDIKGIRCIMDDQVPIGSLSKLRTMAVGGCPGLQHVAASDCIKLLQSLNWLSVVNCKALEVVFDFRGLNNEGSNTEILLGQLESLELNYLHNLKHIWRMLPEGIHIFKNLKLLKVRNCGSLRYLVSPSVAKMLVDLEKLELRGCAQMEAIIGRDERPIVEIESEGDCVKETDGEDSTNKIVFPKLRSIRITNLANCRMLCSEDIDLELPLLATLLVGKCPKFDLYHYLSKKALTLVNLEELGIGSLDGMSRILDDQMPIGSLPKLRTIDVKACDDPRHIAASNSIKSLQSLKTLEVNNCQSLETVFDFRGVNVEGADMESLLDRLQSLKLTSLPNLKHIWRMLPQGIHAFKNLTSLDVSGLNLRCLLSPSMATMLVGLETLVIELCSMMEAIIGRDETLISEIGSEEDAVKKKDGEGNAYKIQFPKLRSLTLVELDNFRMLCSENVDVELPSLTELVIENCSMMTKFCVGQLSATRLDSVQVKYYRELEKNVTRAVFDSWLKESDSKIRCLKCSAFEEERCNHFANNSAAPVDFTANEE